MCNEAYRRREMDKLRDEWSQTGIPLRFPEGMSNFAPLESIRITDRVEIIRAAGGDEGAAEMVARRWSWPGSGGKPVYNYRSDGRTFRNTNNGGRCLIPVDGFFEFTAPPPPAAGDPVPKRSLKAKWAFSMADASGFCIAGIWRSDAAVGEAWTMLTCPPGPDIAAYHDRQVVLIRAVDYAGWISGAATTADLCRPLPEGTLAVERVR